jgi:carbohydrate binding protein with CBM4/9 domain
VTEADPNPGAPPERPIRDGRGPAPEIVGAAFAVIMLAIVGTSVLAGAASPPAAGPSPSPGATSSPIVPASAPPVDPTAVKVLGALNQRLLADSESIKRELDRANLRTAEVASLIRQVNATVAYGADVVPTLGGFLGPDQPGGRLAALYEDTTASATNTLDASVLNDAAYRAGAGVLVKLIDQVPALQAALEALLLGPPASASPAPSASASPSPSPPPATPAAPTSSPTTPPSVPPSSGAPRPAADEQVENNDFEAGVGPPWALLVVAGSAARVTPDTTAPASGKTSARVDITTGSDAYSGISLQQPGIHLVSGGRYTISFSARAAADRFIRVRIASTNGSTYLTRLSPVGVAWTGSTFTFIATVTDPNAVLEFDLGRETPTTWLDAVSFRPAAAGS